MEESEGAREAVRVSRETEGHTSPYGARLPWPPSPMSLQRRPVPSILMNQPVFSHCRFRPAFLLHMQYFCTDS